MGEPDVWLKGKPQELVYGYLAGLMHDWKGLFALLDSLVLYFFVCLAAGDFLIVMIVREHKYAFKEVLEGQDGFFSLQHRTSGPRYMNAAVYRAEREMVEDWCKLLGKTPAMDGGRVDGRIDQGDTIGRRSTGNFCRVSAFSDCMPSQQVMGDAAQSFEIARPSP